MSKSKYQPTNIKTRSTTNKNQTTETTTTTTTKTSSSGTSNNFKTWTSEQVNQWALELDLGDEIATFLKNYDVCGKYLGTLTPNLLREYGLKISFAGALLSAIKKLKKTPRSHDIIYLGLPKLNSMSLSKSRPSINSSHNPAKISVKELPIFDNLKIIKNFPSLIWCLYYATNNSLKWASENDISQLVVTVLRDVIQSLELASKITCQSEVTVNGLIPDIWVLTYDGIPIGVVEVKKPSNVDPTEANEEMENLQVHGQIYDYMLLLSRTYGQKNVFGIVSTYAQWRCYWLYDTFIDMAESVSKPNIMLPYIPIPLIKGSNKKDSTFTPMSREFFATKVYNYNNPDLLKLLANVIYHMYNTGFVHIDLIKKTHFINALEDSMIWVKFSSPLAYNFKFPNLGSIQKVFLIQDLGGGAHGKVWLSCDQKGNVFVLKFFKNHFNNNAENESLLWKKIWGIETKVRIFINNKSLMMPYLKPLSEEDWDDTKIQICINESVKKFISAGYYHLDIKKEHFGKYQSKPGNLHIVFFDLSSVKNITNESMQSKKLYHQKMLDSIKIISQESGCTATPTTTSSSLRSQKTLNIQPSSNIVTEKIKLKKVEKLDHFKIFINPTLETSQLIKRLKLIKKDGNRIVFYFLHRTITIVSKLLFDIFCVFFF
ncbi:hypothetical protein DLAC_09748 [Tieghemostelium lacteum]|uniref:DUF5898 domain-containing protein n=1 Tax=Tieghemostelium lacteum TaxID=361077 RepID=A0A151Z738_TIELA|nr:hypothetical protein DLAC_09748 [Tieghemostelium lacteum]|eukprot:KYQ89781.1 hypothetical protein DLAC_09748 [Tieghemostelium lacteum]